MIIEKEIDGKCYRFRSVVDSTEWPYGCDRCAAHNNTNLCNDLDDSCLNYESSYWKEHIKIKSIK